MSIITELRDPRAQNRALCGGKAASLSALFNAQVPVPEGFVISSQVFSTALASSQTISLLLQDMRDARERAAFFSTGARLAAEILSLELPSTVVSEIETAFAKLNSEYVAVRSSAPEEDNQENSWAGQFETYLGVKQAFLVERVKGCWASVFSPRALEYRLACGLEQAGFSMAVVVQRMVSADAAGVAFSFDPVLGQNILVEMVLGLGEPLVSGELTPSSYLLDRNSGKTVSEKIAVQERALKMNVEEASFAGTIWESFAGPKEVRLSLELLEELGAHLLRLEKAWNTPLDIEWCVSGGALYLLQARPLTRLPQLSANADYTRFQALRGRFHFSWAECHPLISAENWIGTYLSHRDIPGGGAQAAMVYLDEGFVSSYSFSEDLPRMREEAQVLLDPSRFGDYLTHSLRLQQGWAELYKRWQKELADNSKCLKDSQILLEYYETYQNLFDTNYALYKLSQPECSDVAADALREELSKQFPEADLRQIMFHDLIEPLENDIVQEEEIALTQLSLRPEVSDSDLLGHGLRFAWLFFNTYDRQTAQQYLRDREAGGHPLISWR